MISTLTLLAVGITCGDRVQRVSPERPKVLLDAALGAMTAMTFLPTRPAIVVAVFLVFRLLDLLRPFGIDDLTSLPGGAGWLLPAFAAGVIANVAVQLLVVLPDLAP